jgi:predicted dehydrogenase
MGETALTRLRIAVVGLGAIGLKHAEIIAHEDMCELGPIADPTAAAREFAAAHGVRHFPTLEALLESDRPDGAIIGTPNALHRAGGIACMEAGVPALVEKPIADTLAAALALSHAAERTGVPLLIGHHRRHNPLIRRAREVIEDGKLGRLTAVTSLWMARKPDGYYDVPWRREAGGGPVLINFIHDVDLLRFMCGEIESIQSMTSNAVRGFSVEDTAVAIVRFENGALGTLTTCDASVSPWSWELSSGENPFYPRQHEICYLLTGTEGSLSLPKLEYWHYGSTKGWDQPLLCEVLDAPQDDPLAIQLRHFCRVIRGEEPPLISGADGARTLATAVALHRAARTGHRVSVDEIIKEQDDSPKVDFVVCEENRIGRKQ